LHNTDGAAAGRKDTKANLSMRSFPHARTTTGVAREKQICNSRMRMHLITLSGLMLHSHCTAYQKAWPETTPEYEHYPSPATPTTSHTRTHSRSRLQRLQWSQ